MWKERLLRWKSQRQLTRVDYARQTGSGRALVLSDVLAVAGGLFILILSLSSSLSSSLLRHFPSFDHIWPDNVQYSTTTRVPPPLSSPDIFISIFLLFSGFFCHLHAQPTYTQQQNNCSCCEIGPDFIYFVSSLPPHSVFSLFFIPWKISRYKIQEKRLDKNYLKWLVNGRASRDAWRHIHQTPLAQDPSSWLVVWIPAETRNNDFQEK